MKQLTIDDLRDVMSEQIQAIRTGKGDLTVADALANMTGKILKSLSLEIAYNLYKDQGGQEIKMMEYGNKQLKKISENK
jgi:hypothetical protein